MTETMDGQEDLIPDSPGDEPRTMDSADGDGADGVVHQLRTEALRDADAGDDWRNLHRMLDVPLSLTVELGSTEMPLSEVLRLEGGSVITIDRTPGEPIDLLINGRVFARGEVVVINDTFGYRITELVDDAESTIEIDRDGG